MFSKPRIAVLIPRDYWTRPFSATAGNGGSHRALPDILDALESSGAEAVALSPETFATPSSFQGLLLPGGVDIHPRFYGQQLGPHMDPAGLDVEYDEFELEWARWALEKQRPVLGICRGMQLLNVAAGGTLHQHLPEHLPEGVLERPELRRQSAHALVLKPDSSLASVLSGVEAVNSIHHQAVDRVALGWQATAWAHDGVVEAIEGRLCPWQRGVQFHPEDLRHLPPFQALFEQLVLDARVA